MGMRLNKETTLEHLPLHKLGFYECEDGEIVVLFQCNLEYCVASFKYGVCTNGQSFDYDKKRAWQFFVEVVQDDLVGKVML
jgi:hypothetical protein